MKMFSTVFTSLSILLLFLLSITFFVLGTVFYVISSNIDQVFLFNPSANVFVTFITFIIRTVELVELIELMNSVILSQMTLLRWLIFLLAFLTVALTILPFWIYFFLLMLVFVLQWYSICWEILIMFLFQFLLTFHQTQNWIPISSYTL